MNENEAERFIRLKEVVIGTLNQYADATINFKKSDLDPKLKWTMRQKGIDWQNATNAFTSFSFS